MWRAFWCALGVHKHFSEGQYRDYFPASCKYKPLCANHSEHTENCTRRCLDCGKLFWKPYVYGVFE
jgi:hypothetical protein